VSSSWQSENYYTDILKSATTPHRHSDIPGDSSLKQHNHANLKSHKTDTTSQVNGNRASSLTLKWPVFKFANPHKINNPIENNFTYLGKKRKCSTIFKECCMMSYLPQDAIHFIILTSSVQKILRFFINHTLQIDTKPII
jgi:hypothetical protein